MITDQSKDRDSQDNDELDGEIDRCHSPGCMCVVDNPMEYCSKCDDPRTDVEKVQATYVNGNIDERELEAKLEIVLQ